MVGAMVGLIGVALTVFSHRKGAFPYFLSLQVLAGISSGLGIAGVCGYLADYTGGSQALRMRIMSFYELATSGGLAAGVVVGGFAWDRFGRSAFGLLALGYLVVAFCMFQGPKMKEVVEQGELSSIVDRYWRVVRTPRLFIFIPAWISITALLGIWVGPQLTFILSSNKRNPHQLLMGSLSGHGGGGHLSLVLGAIVLFFGLCLLFWAFFLNRAPRLLLMLSSITGVYLACIALAGINHFGASSVPLLVIWVVLLLVGVFADSTLPPAAPPYLPHVSDHAPTDPPLLTPLYSAFLPL